MYIFVGCCGCALSRLHALFLLLACLLAFVLPHRHRTHTYTQTRKEWRATMKENEPRRTTIKTEKKNAMHIAAPLCVALLQGTTARIAHNANDALRICKAFGLCHAVLGSSLLRFCLPFCSPFLFHFILIRNFASRRT